MIEAPYKIRRVVPRFHWNTDALIGTTHTQVDTAYTEGGALVKLRTYRRTLDEDAIDYGIGFEVVKNNRTVYPLKPSEKYKAVPI